MVGLVLRKFYSPAKFRGTVRYGKNFSTETRKFLSLGREVVLYQLFCNFSKFPPKFRARKFPSLGNLSIFVSTFFESNRNGSIDGRKNADA